MSKLIDPKGYNKNRCRIPCLTEISLSLRSAYFSRLKDLMKRYDLYFSGSTSSLLSGYRLLEFGDELPIILT